MKSIALRTAILGAAILLIVLPCSLQAQQPSGAGPGIWIAGPDGRLRNVEPVHAPLAVAVGPGRPAAQAPAVRIVFEVEHHARSASGAMAGGELAVARIASALTAFGVIPADIEAEPAFVLPRRERRLLAGSWEQPRITRYEAGHTVMVTVRDPTRVGLLIDRAVGAGATRVIAIETER
jgi:uncharacterized protein YggE